MGLDRMRSEFSVTKKYAYLDHAAVGPLPTRAVKAASQVIEEKCEGDLHWYSWEEKAEATRRLIATLIGARAEEIALVHSTSEGIAIVGNGLTYDKGSNIVTCDLEFASNLFPWQAISRRHDVELRVVRNRNGSLQMEDFQDAIDAKTKLVAISYVQYSNGFRIDLEELSKIAHENDAYVVTDAVQAVGQMPVDVSKLGVDFLATSGYKWMLSPISTGFLYVRHELLDDLWPTIVGYRADREPMKFSFREFEPAPTAQRFEDGQLNFPGFAGMRESIALLQGVGIGIIWDSINSLINRLIDGLKQDTSVRVRSCLEESSRSGILNLACRDPDLAAKRLLEHDVVTSVRDGGLRVSPHFYNTENEIDRLLAELSVLSSQR